MDDDARRRAAASCRATGRNPAGGFCLGERALLAKGADAGCVPPKLALALGHLFANASVLDVGTGSGRYGAAFARHSPTVHWVGVDGADGVEEQTGGRVRFADLTVPLPRAGVLGGPLRPGFDFAMSIEVGEHIPRPQEPAFMHNLARAARRGVVLSWARLGQSGTHHVNCQHTRYVACAMRLLGWAHDAPTQERLRAAVVGNQLRHCYWLRTTVQAFKPAAACEPSALCPLPPTPTPAFSEAYLRATRDMCPFVHDGCNRTRHPWRPRELAPERT